MRGAGVARGVAREERGARVLAVMRVQPSCSRECSRPLTAGSHCCRLRRLSRRRRALPLLAGRCAAGTRPVIAFAESPHCAPLFGRTALAQPNVTPKNQISRLTALPLHVWGSEPEDRLRRLRIGAALACVRVGAARPYFGVAFSGRPYVREDRWLRGRCAPPRRCRSACGRGGAPASPAGATVCFNFRAAKCSKSQEISCFQGLVPQGVWIGARLRRKQI